MKQIDIKFIANSAIIAALYVALTWILAPISYGSIQFRISEALVLLVLLNKKYAVAILIGTFISNTTSSLGYYDMLFGTLATLLAIIPMLFIKKPYLGAIFPVISNAIIVSIELLIVFEINFWFSFVAVGIGEAVVLYLIGIPFIHFLAKNEALATTMELDTSHIKENRVITMNQIIVFTLAIIGIIFFFTYPVFNNLADEEEGYLTIFNLAANIYYLWTIFASIIIYAIFGLINNKVRYFGLLFILAILIIYSFIPTIIGELNIAYFIGYYLYIALLAFSIIFIKKKED